MDIAFALLFLIMGAVLVLPFASHRVEEELEIFLLVMGSLAVTTSRLWSGHLALEALREPIKISLAVLVFGYAFKRLRGHLRRGVAKASLRIGIPALLFLTVAGLGLLSSVVTAIIAALALVEIISALNLPKANETRVVVLACFSIGLGAALTPLGEPLSTIAVSKLAGEPHHAGFFFLAGLLGAWVLPGILIVSWWAARQGAGVVPRSQSLTQDAPETLRDIVLRAVKVYAFVAALVLLSTGLSPIIDRYVLGTSRSVLFWLNSVSAVLDNATLAAAEISPRLAREDVRFLLVGLLVAGGMLIPGNIPNIIAAKKLDIKSKEWAAFGAPLGLGLMIVYFVFLKALS